MSAWLLGALVLSVTPARLANPAFPPPPGAGDAAAQPDRPAPEASPSLAREDLAPYFVDGPLAEAKAAFDQGRFTRARELLEPLVAMPPARFLRALAGLRAHLDAAAAAELEGLADDYGALKGRCLFLAGQAFERLGRWNDAERVFARARFEVEVELDARLGHARALKGLGRFAEALEEIAPLGDRPAPPWGRDAAAEALALVAEVKGLLGDRPGAKAALIELWSRHPLSREARRLEGRLGDPSALPPPAQVARGEALVEAHHNAEGAALLTPFAAPSKLPDPLACRAGLALGRAQRKLRAHAQAIATLTLVAKKCSDPTVRARSLYTLGTSETFAAPELAAGTFEALAAEAEGSSLADDALLLAAEAHLKRGEKEAGIDRLLALVDRFPFDETAADGLFRLFWIHRAEGKVDEALTFLDEIEGRFGPSEDSFEVERARYWRGRVLESLDRRDEALGLYESVSREHPATYYGLISRERVEALDPERGERLAQATAASLDREDPLPLPLGALADDRLFRSAVELARLGLGGLVPTEILGVDRSRLGPDQVRILVLVLSAANEERAAHGLARVWLRRELAGPITRAGRALWEIAYPKAFRDIVEARAKEADELDPNLLQALMREESALDPKALSWAGALGLCQLMPATASEVASKLKLGRPSVAGLLEPDLNIRLGGRYLADLLVRARGTTQFALAGYNAGEGAVSRWRRELGDQDLAAWVEQIPVQETRGYVRRVLRSYAAYKLLYDPTRAPRSVHRLPTKEYKRPKT